MATKFYKVSISLLITNLCFGFPATVIFYLFCFRYKKCPELCNNLEIAKNVFIKSQEIFHPPRLLGPPYLLSTGKNAYF
jgi:hypothetical protein